MSDPGFVLWTYRHHFLVDGREALVTLRSGLKGVASTLSLGGVEQSCDFTPASGPDSVRNHRLTAPLYEGRVLDVETGYNSWVATGMVARIGPVVTHESHPGRPVGLPERARKMMSQTTADGKAAMDYSKLKDSRYAIAVDIVTGLLFFAVAKLTDLTTAALVGAGVGIALVVAQRFIKVDIIGGLALFGIAMLLISAGFALAFQDDEIIKLRSTIVGLIGAGAFFADALLLKGKWLGAGLSRYIAYADIVPRRLSMAMGTIGAIMALLNLVAIRLLTTDGWLFYTTFVDIFLSIGLIIYGIGWARARPASVR